MARRIFVVLMLAALGSAGFFMLKPVSAEVPASIIPDEILSAIQFRIGGPVGITVNPDELTATVSCGPPIARQRLELRTSNVVQDFIASAAQLEDRANEECNKVTAKRLGLAGVAGVAALLLLILALVSRERPRQIIVIQQPAATASSSPLPPPTGPPLAITTTAARRAPRTRRRAFYWSAGICAVALAGAVLIANSHDAPEESGFASTNTRDTQAIDCIRSAMDETDRLFEVAQAESKSDQEAAIINSDGDSSWRDYAVSLDGLKLSECPLSFQSAFSRFSSAWKSYGDALLSSTEGLLPDSMSDEELSGHALELNSARADLQTIADQYGAVVRRSTYTFG